MNASLANAFSTAFSFTPHVLGKEFLAETLGIPETTFSQTGLQPARPPRASPRRTSRRRTCTPAAP